MVTVCYVGSIVLLSASISSGVKGFWEDDLSWFGLAVVEGLGSIAVALIGLILK